jgi:hypothetical protein
MIAFVRGPIETPLQSQVVHDVEVTIVYFFFIGLYERQPALGRRHEPDRLCRQTRAAPMTFMH